MKDNNLNNSKNVEYIDIIYKPEGQITKSVYELLKNSKEGDYNSLKQLIDEKEFQGSTLNLAFRNLINSYKPDNQNFINCLKLLLSTNIDLNYKYQKENNHTILMMVYSKVELYLLKDFLTNLHIKINSVNNNCLSDEEKEKLEMKEKAIFFSQKDLNNNNFLNLINTGADKNELLNIFIYIYEEYPFYNNPKPENSEKIQEIFKNLLLEKNNDGNTLMNICLFRGMPKYILKLISINGYIPNTNNQNNNYIHCAILGKNLTSLKILLYYCSLDELNMENCEGLTPTQLAFKLGFVMMSNIIIEYQNNFNIVEYKEHFYSILDIYEEKVNNLSNDLLINFTNYKYKQVLYELNELKIINNIVCENLFSKNNNLEKEEEIIYKISYLKIEWNIILTKIKISQNISEKDFENNNIMNNNINNKAGKNNKKKLKKFEEKYKNSVVPFLKSILDIFENIFTSKFISSYIDLIYQIKNKENINYFNTEISIDILIYNKIIFYFKFGYINSITETAQLYLTKIFPIYKDNNSNIKPFILYVNISCILAEILISQGYYNFAEIIISALDKYLFINFQIISNNAYKEEKPIFEYLTKTVVFNQFSPYLSDILCYSNFLKLLITKDKIKELFTQIQKNLPDSRFTKYPTIFKRLNILYSCIEIKKLYEKEDNQIQNKISVLHNYGEDGEIYYFNTLGIIYLKKQKFNLSKMFFTKAFNKYIHIIKNKNIKDNNKERLLNFRIDYITSFLYNISLCHFYLKNYNKCIIILEQLLSFKNNQKNYFIHYRLALCYFHLYVNDYKKYSDYYNENILKVVGYENGKNKIKKHKSNKALSIDLENEDINENLSSKFDTENKNYINKKIYNNNLSSCEDKKYLKNNLNNNLNNNEINNINNYLSNNNLENKLSAKKIILKNTTKFINNNINNIFQNKNNNFNIDNNKYNIFNHELYKNKNIIITYIEKATNHFKKVIIISKMNTYTTSMKSIYNFYSTYIEEKNEKKGENIHKKKKIPNDLLINTYLNLLLCLSIKKNWLEIIFITKTYNIKKNFSNKIIFLKILLYKLEAYINLKNKHKIQEIIKEINKLLKGFKKIELPIFNKANNDIINEVNIKLYLYYTLTIIGIKEKNYNQIEINVNKIKNLVKDEKNIPYYIIDLLINVFIIKLNNESNLNPKNKYKYNNIILNLIKNKKINKVD